MTTTAALDTIDAILTATVPGWVAVPVIALGCVAIAWAWWQRRQVIKRLKGQR
jgi:hypothetical protein